MRFPRAATAGESVRWQCETLESRRSKEQTATGQLSEKVRIALTPPERWHSDQLSYLYREANRANIRKTL
jgi:hypothetical protein